MTLQWEEGKGAVETRTLVPAAADRDPQVAIS